MIAMRILMTCYWSETQKAQKDVPWMMIIFPVNSGVGHELFFFALSLRGKKGCSSAPAKMTQLTFISTVENALEYRVFICIREMLQMVLYMYFFSINVEGLPFLF